MRQREIEIIEHREHLRNHDDARHLRVALLLLFNAALVVRSSARARCQLSSSSALRFFSASSCVARSSGAGGDGLLRGCIGGFRRLRLSVRPSSVHPLFRSTFQFSRRRSRVVYNSVSKIAQYAARRSAPTKSSARSTSASAQALRPCRSLRMGCRRSRARCRSPAGRPTDSPRR